MKVFRFLKNSGDKESLSGLLTALLEKKYSVIAPVAYQNTLLFRKINTADEVVLPSDYVNTVRSAKEFVFPITEPVVEFSFGKDTIKLNDCIPESSTKVIFGLRPCDTAAFPVIDDVFNYQYKDEFYNRRRGDIVFISAACERADESCFCTTVGLSPDSPAGSDILIKKLKSGETAAAALTDKGEILLEGLSDLFSNGVNENIESHPVYKQVEEKIRKPLNLDKIKSWLDGNFQNEAWNEIGASCLGCATCAYLCPTCHCFDIVDETKYDHGLRRKNWDVCQFPVFTVHASGHNPRSNQTKRYRQRVMHKFKYYRDRFNKTLCTGCGRCIRACPVNLDIYEVVSEIAAKREEQ